MDKKERISRLREAQIIINRAIVEIRRAVAGTNVEASAEAYIIPHLDNWSFGSNPYDQTIPVLMKEIEAEYADKDMIQEDPGPEYLTMEGPSRKQS